MDGMVHERLSRAHSSDPGSEAASDVQQDLARDAAFAAMVDRNAALLYRVAFALLRHSQDAEDAVQETLLKLYRTGSWTQMQDEAAFLARSVWRVGLSRMSASGAKAMRYAEDIAEINPPSGARSPEDDAVDAAEQMLLRALIEQLPENFRQALVLSAIEGLGGHQVAELLGVPEATVRTRVMRAKQELRRRFVESNSRKEAGR